MSPDYVATSSGLRCSLFARKDRLPVQLRTTTESDDGVGMTVEHHKLPVEMTKGTPDMS